MSPTVEHARLRLSESIQPQKKSLLGQYFTPTQSAQFMARLFVPVPAKQCRLLDPGAGIGCLASAFLERCITGELGFESVEITAVEIDESLHQTLNTILVSYAARLPLNWEIVGEDFIELGVNRLRHNQDGGFTHAILNPPYRKIDSTSHHRVLLRQVGIETVNLYSAFVALALALMMPGGQLVAIIPRSFCNGPYYRSFRRFLLERTAIHHVHLFASRDKAFKDDDVLQENVIILLERDGKQSDVTISTSTDDSFVDLVSYSIPFERIVFSDDGEQFIHVPTSPDFNTIERSSRIRYSLDDIGVQVSTGPVVDFRVKKHIRDMPDAGAVPLLYPGHFRGQRTEWPNPRIKKPNAISRNHETEKWLYRNGFYCVVRRFSSKEEKRRIVASVVQPSAFPDAAMLGFENHLNVFHDCKQGLPEALAHGLAMFLNTSAVDEHFRRFSGHTQVNATDLRFMKYPSREALLHLGEWAMQREELTQDIIDEQLEVLLS